MGSKKPPVTLADLLNQRILELRPPTQETLAELLDVSQPTVARWLDGVAPSWERADVLAKVLDLSVEEVERIILAARRRHRTQSQRLDDFEQRLSRIEELLESRRAPRGAAQ